MRALLIDEGAKQKVARVLAYARRPDNFWEPGKLPLPGDNPNLQVHLDSFRCVFSITKMEGKLFRHLSISVPGTKYPNTYIGFTIATMFGFTGWNERDEPAPDWEIGVDKPARAAVIAQKLRDGEMP